MAAGAAVQGFQALNTILQGIAQYNASKKDAKVLNEQGNVAKAEVRREGARIVDAQRVAFAKSGVDPNTGTSADIQALDEGRATLRALRARYPFEQGARDVRAQGKSALLQAGFQALGQVAGAAGSAGGGGGGAASLGAVQRVSGS